MIEDEIVGCHNQHNGHEFEQAPGVGDGQGSLVCYSPWGCKQSDMTEQLTEGEGQICSLVYFKDLFSGSSVQFSQIKLPLKILDWKAHSQDRAHKRGTLDP